MSERVVHSCCVCKKRFQPHPRLSDRQRTCGRDNCQKWRRRLNSRDWRARNPGGDDATYRRIRRRDRRAYRRQYWAAHPEARARHAVYMRQWRTRRVRDPYRDTGVKLPDINTYLQVTDVREANRVMTVKLLSANEFMAASPM